MQKSILTFSLILLLAGGMVWAQMPAPDKPMSPPGMGCGKFKGEPPGRCGMMPDDDDNFFRPNMRCLAGLDLSAEQKNKIDKLFLEHHRTMTEMHTEMAGVKGKIALLITSDKFSQSDLNELSRKVSKFAEQMVLKRVEHARQIREVLTPEQRVIFDQGILSRPGKGGPGFHRGMGMRGKGFGCGSGDEGCCGGEGCGMGKMGPAGGCGKGPCGQ